MSTQALRVAPVGLLAATAVAVPAAAQESEIEEIVVTGTYIRRPSQFDSPSPLVNMTADDVADRSDQSNGYSVVMPSQAGAGCRRAATCTATHPSRWSS